MNLSHRSLRIARVMFVALDRNTGEISMSESAVVVH